jgi:hypothetical protein
MCARTMAGSSSCCLSIFVWGFCRVAAKHYAAAGGGRIIAPEFVELNVAERHCRGSTPNCVAGAPSRRRAVQTYKTEKGPC